MTDTYSMTNIRTGISIGVGISFNMTIIAYTIVIMIIVRGAV